MNYKRIGRALMCLVLICCLMVQTVPRADATGAGLVATITGVSSVTVSAPLVVGASLIALGVMAANTNPLVFENVVNDAVDSLSAAGQWVADGAVELLRTVDEAGNAMYYAAGDMLEGLRSWLFDNSIVNSCVSLPGDLSSKGSIAFERALSYPYACIVTLPSGTFWIAYSTSPLVVYDHSPGVKALGYTYDCWNSYKDSFSNSSTGHIVVTDASVTFFGTANPDPLYSDLDLSLGQISSVPVDGSSALDWAPEYQAKRLKVIEGGNDPDPDSDPPNDGKWFWPLALTATTAELLLMSQADQWSGESSPEFGDYTTGTEFEIVSRPEFEGDQQLELAPLTNPEPGTGTNPDPDVGGDSGGDFGEQPDYTSWFRRIIELMEELLERFKTWCTDCKTAIEELPSKFAKWFDNICETLGNIWEWCQNLVSGLIDALQNLLSALFAPSADFIPNKVSALVAKYPYLETFTGLGTSLKAFFLNLGSKPPIIYIDLGAATGSYFFGGRQAFIDLTWYSDYKPTMDAILGAFIWLWLAWRVFHALPGIINGMSGTVGERVSYSGTQNINLPPLPPQNELPPGHNRRM